MPSEFARQPRSISELDRWKATEFRQFLLYTGPVVLKNVLSEDHYTHFLCLSVAMSILLDSSHEKRHAYLSYAKELMHTFVSNCPKLYGVTFTVYNVHGLLHMCDDVTNFECSLNDLSAFPFENYLQTLKKHIKNSKNPIVQVTKRVKEIEKLASLSKSKKAASIKVSQRPKDAWFVLDKGEYAMVQEVLRHGMFVCDIIKPDQTSSFFSVPCDSKLIDVVYVQRLAHRTRKRTLHRNQLIRKAVCLPYKEGHVIFPLLHEIEKQ